MMADQQPSVAFQNEAKNLPPGWDCKYDTNTGKWFVFGSLQNIERFQFACRPKIIQNGACIDAIAIHEIACNCM